MLIAGEGAEPMENGGEDELADAAFVAKADFAFGGVDVDVHGGGINFEEEDGRRVAPFRDVGMVGLEDGVGKRAGVHRAAVDEGDEAVARGAALARATQEAGEAEGVRWQRLGGGRFFHESDGRGEIICGRVGG